MAVIDIGAGATDRNTSLVGGYSVVDLGNPANATGILDNFEVWVYENVANFMIGTFSGSGTDYDDRDYETIGDVTAGSKQTFTGKNCSVTIGDFLGAYCTSGKYELSGSGGAGIYYRVGNPFGSGSLTYTAMSGRSLSIYATGATVAAGSLPLKNVFGRPFRGVFR